MGCAIFSVIFIYTIPLLAQEKILLAPIMNDNFKYGFIDTTGKIVIDTIYNGVYYFSEGLAAVNIGGQTSPYNGDIVDGYWGFVDKTGKMVIKPKFRKREIITPSGSISFLFIIISP